MNVSPQRGIYSRRFAWAIGAAFSYVYFVELPRYKASASLELTPGASLGGSAAPVPAAAESALGEPFPPENFSLPHDTSGLLTMVADEPGGLCGTAFAITLKACPEFDGR